VAEKTKNTDDGSLVVQVFFCNSRINSKGFGDEVFAVERLIPRTPAVARYALEELLKGPTPKETAQGYSTNINSGVHIQTLVIEDRIAKIDFNEQLQADVAGSCRVSAIRAQITQTLKQFPTVDDVIISINGRTEDILQP
jgi:spore germination protein GerM